VSTHCLKLVSWFVAPLARPHFLPGIPEESIGPDLAAAWWQEMWATFITAMNVIQSAVN
jgi:hypothetical protein